MSEYARSKRERFENKIKRKRRPGWTSICAALVCFWGVVWVVSVVAYFAVALSRKRQQPEEHEHKALRAASVVLQQMKRPWKGDGSCIVFAARISQARVCIPR